MNDFETTMVAGLNTACLTRKQLAEIMAKDCLRAREGGYAPKLVFSSNGQGVSLAAKSKQFKEVMQSADIIHADGQSIVFGSRLFSQKALPERIATTDFFHDAASKAEEAGLSFYMLGATEDENRIAYENIKKMYPRLKLVGRMNGYFSETETQRVIGEINIANPDVLWVALGKPKQEFWCAAVSDQLNVGWIKTCGGLFAFLAGTSPRAPDWMQRAGLEWLFRAYKAPKRLGWRYMITNPHALWLMATKSS